MFLDKKIEDDFELGNKLKEFEGGSINGSDKGGSQLGGGDGSALGKGSNIGS
jgi:hypothetical protein